MMYSVWSTFGNFLIYLMQTSLFAAFCLFVSGVVAGFAVCALMKGQREEGSRKTARNRRVLIAFSVSFAFLLCALILGGAEGTQWYWPVYVAGAGIGIFLRLTPIVSAGVVSLLGIVCVVLLLSLLLSLRSLVGQTVVLHATVADVKQVGDKRVSTILIRHEEDDREQVFTVTGTQWGIRLNIMIPQKWVVFLGGKAYYRLHSVVGQDGAMLNMHSFHSSSQKGQDGFWERLEGLEGKMPGVRSVQRMTVQKMVVKDRAYALVVDHTGAVVLERTDTRR